MLQQSLGTIQSELNGFMKLQFDHPEDMVLLSNFLNLDGSTALKTENKIIITLINLEHETVIGNRPENGETSEIKNDPIHLNAYILFSAYFGDNNYSEALKFLSQVIAFFQGKKVFDHQNTPSLSKGIEKLIFKMQSSSFQELSHLWSMLGAKYMPSVVYQMRLIAIDSKFVRAVIPTISGTETAGKKR